jgi:coenzyme F420 hydrogenase subunit beta
MKTFENLMDEVQKAGLCHHCGGCVTFCTSINYGALELDDIGMPHFGNREKCIECGLCYSICPEIDELDAETKKAVNWTPPIGHIFETNIARSKDAAIRTKATDGGVVTALLLHLFERGHIDGAIVTKQTGPFSREPWLATSKQEIIDAAGFFFDTSHGIKHFSHGYSTYSPSVQEFRPMLQKGLRRVAMVGTPCQIKAVRKIEALGIVPSDSIKYCLGLFCSGNFSLKPEDMETLRQIGKFQWEDVKKVNVKESLMIHLHNGQIKSIDLKDVSFMKRYACQYCSDYSSEFADISFGGIGSPEGWTTVITRTPLGRAIFADARDQTIELFQNPEDIPKALAKVQQASSKKQNLAESSRKKLQNTDSI